MIKVLEGKYKGRKLNNFNINHVRPTQARVKKSIMDTLMPFENKTILDLFSGVGTLGIESISRGAKSVCFVENKFSVVKILKKNIEMLNIINKCDVQKLDVISYLKKTHSKYDIVFADPPYYKYNFINFIPLIKPILEKNGVFCFESDYNKNLNEINLNLKDVKLKKFGNTQVIIWRKK